MVAGVLVALAAAAAIALGGCGADNKDDAVSVQAQSGLPSDLASSFVAAGDGVGWIAGKSEGQEGIGLWRSTPNGTASEVSTVPDMISTEGAALDDRLAVAGLRCIEGDVDSGCRGTTAEVLLVDRTGDVTNVTLFEKDGALGDGDGLSVAGSTGDSVWISTEEGLFEVSAGGRVARRLPTGSGGECVIDGSLYRFISGLRGARQAEGAPPTTMVAPNQPADGVELEIQRLDGDTFRGLPGATRTLDDSSYVNLRCTNTALEAADANGVLTARWTPAEGWLTTRGVAAPDTVTTVVPTASSGTFALDDDGAVLKRSADGAFTPTGIHLPDLTEAGQIPPSLTVSQSPSTLVACTTRSTSETDIRTVCQTAAAG